MKIRLLNQGGCSRFAKLDFPIEVEATEHGSSSQGLIGYLVSASELERLGVSTFGAPLCFRPELTEETN